MTFAGQLKAASLRAWLVISAGVLLVLLAPFAVPAKLIDKVTPVCEWKVKYNRECALCGMTTSFLLISGGRFREASHRNQASIPLYGALVSNEFAAAWFLRSRLRRRMRKRRNRAGQGRAEGASCQC